MSAKLSKVVEHQAAESEERVIYGRHNSWPREEHQGKPMISEESWGINDSQG